ncbi:hypothetical protein ACVRY7_02195 [Streptococcus ictaluri]|uniref:Uncharacterized protein n=1 Tax=Streptococcus ictaluri 707-05 TaxID=764299 RepID=G5K2I9_9STRE|nr:hypothetical protein [Streptococcus ictaluri]EHI69490.1 hypothetical protein STRIC_1001 [Streptococcus ictaluri 707-05]
MDKKDSIQKVAKELGPEAGRFYQNMIEDFQKGYADYVFQTDKIETQARRLKHLGKS